MTRAYMIASAIQSNGYPVKVLGYLPTGETIYPSPPNNLNVEVIYASSYSILLLKLARKLNDDIIYAIKPRANSFGAALFAKKFRRNKLILDIDDWEPSFYNMKKAPHLLIIWKNIIDADFFSIVNFIRCLNGFKYANGLRSLYRLEKKITTADVVTTNTKFLQKKYNAFYLPSVKDTFKFDPSRFKANDARTELGLSKFKILMFPGTPRIHKGLEDLLTALELLDQTNLRLVIVGGRNEGNIYTNKLLERWNKWIIRLPQVAFDDMPKVIAAAHIVVIPQRNTPTAYAQCPMKLTDAMSMAKPILTTYVGDIPDIVGDTAYLVEPGSPDAIAKTITRIFQKPEEARSKGEKARLRCIKYLSIEKISQSLVNILEN